MTLSFKCISLQKVSNFKFGFSRQSGFHKMRELSHCRLVSQRQNIECEAFSSNIGLWPSVGLALRHETMVVACDTPHTTTHYPLLPLSTPHHPIPPPLPHFHPPFHPPLYVSYYYNVPLMNYTSLGLSPAPFSSPLHPPAHHPQPLFTENPASTLISSQVPLTLFLSSSPRSTFHSLPLPSSQSCWVSQVGSTLLATPPPHHTSRTPKAAS